MLYRKRLTREFEIIKTPLFPKKYKKLKSITSKRGEFVLLGIGGNVGDTIRIFKRLIYKLKSFQEIKVLSSSIILKNPPFGYEYQPHFYNSLILIHTSLSPKKLLRLVLKIEKNFKRKREFTNSPRTLDIDIIFYGNRISSNDILKLPHPYWSKRKSVLIPMRFLPNRREFTKIFKKLLTKIKRDSIIPPQIKRQFDLSNL